MASIKPTEISDFDGQLVRLGIQIPTGIGILPQNTETAEKPSDLHFGGTAKSVLVLLRQEGVKPQLLQPENSTLPVLGNNAADWIGPLIFIGAGLWSQHPDFVSISLNVLSNYITDWFKGDAKPSQVVMLSFVIEKSNERKYIRCDFEGTATEIPQLANLLRELAND